jgi:hypothetical protein
MWWQNGDPGTELSKQWTEAPLRKQKVVPLCRYHHDQYHNGKLNYADLKRIMTFKKMQD